MTIEVPRAHQIFVNARAILWREGKNGIEYVVQVRDRPGQRQSLEFPGGTVKAHETNPIQIELFSTLPKLLLRRLPLL